MTSGDGYKPMCFFEGSNHDLLMPRRFFHESERWDIVADKLRDLESSFSNDASQFLKRLLRTGRLSSDVVVNRRRRVLWRTHWVNLLALSAGDQEISSHADSNGSDP